MTTSIIVVDSNPILRLGLKELFKISGNLVVVGEASRCSDGCPLISSLRPDLVVFDLELEDYSGSDIIRRFRERFPEVRAVVYTKRQDSEFVADALGCHIQGYVLKTSPIARLVDAVQYVAEGLSYIDPTVTPMVLSRLARLPQATSEPVFSEREVSVLTLLSLGKQNKEIAQQLKITERTVKFHVSAILRQLGARNRTHAVRIAENKQLLSLPVETFGGAGELPLLGKP